MEGKLNDERVTQELGWLCLRSGSDFAALAGPIQPHRTVNWEYAVGSRNGRIYNMKIIPGVGLGGIVLRHGTTYVVDGSDQTGITPECPVILAEKLITAAAFPLPSSNAAQFGGGVLLLGRREPSKYEGSDIQLLKTLLPRLVEMMNSDTVR